MMENSKAEGRSMGGAAAPPHRVAARKRFAEVTGFWRKEPFTEQERALLKAVLKAHRKSVFRDNPSSIAMLNGFAASGRLVNGVASALMTLGGPHAPIEETALLLMAPNPAEVARQIMGAGGKVPGWGNSFVKGGVDPVWAEVAELLKAWPDIAAKIQAIDEVVNDGPDDEEKIFPNPSCFTAAAGVVLGMPVPLVPLLFVAGRIDGWAELAFKRFQA